MSDCKAPEFDAADGYHAAELAELVYFNWATVKSRLARLGYPLFKSFDHGSTEAFVAANDKEVVYCFRGTTSVKDWFSNLDAFTVKLDGKQSVHEGFYKAMMQVDTEMLAQIIEWHNPDKKLTGIGHSLGAACCVLFSKLLVCYLNPTVWLFGCPRTGNRRFAREYNFSPLGSRTFRVVNENDVVTRVPSFLRWRHVGRFYYIDWRGQLTQNPSKWRRVWNQLIGRVVSWYRSHDWHAGITRHLMGGPCGYVATMRKLLQPIDPDKLEDLLEAKK